MARSSAPGPATPRNGESTAPSGISGVRGAVLERTASGLPYADSQPLVVSEFNLQTPGPGEILVRIHAASVCHSDLSVVDGTRRRQLPTALGHECAGEVVSLGPGVDDLDIDDHVVLVFMPRCGHCVGCLSEGRRPCVHGSDSNARGTLLSGARRIQCNGTRINHHLGVSGFATHAVVDRSSAVKIDPDVPFDVAALLGCAVLTGGGAVVNAAKPRPGDSLAVVGLGGVGMAALQVARAIGVERITGIDMKRDKLELAERFGATSTATPDEALGRGERFDIVIEAVGRSQAFETAFALTTPGGHTVTVGLPDPDDTVTLSPSVITAEARRITGSYLGSAVPSRDIPQFIQLWREGKLPVEQLASSRITLDEINNAMDALREGRVLRQVIDLGHK